MLITGGRTGIDFFQSLLDSHTQISQFPGSFYYDEFWEKSSLTNNLEDIAKMFINDYKFYFDSKHNKEERHHMLGEDKNSFYTVNKDLFIKYFAELMQNKTLNQKDLLFSLHLAYSKASGEDLSKKKIVIVNIHHYFRLKSFEDLDFEVVYTIRDPLANLTSIINHDKYRDKPSLIPWTLFFHIKRILYGLNEVISSKKKIHVIKLENLHIDNKKVMKAFCSIFDINFNETMTKSTYHGEKWWGDQISGKLLDGVNPKFKNKIDENLFYKKDITILETCLKNFLLKYKYPLHSDSSKVALLKYLPLKIEVMIWKKTFLSCNLKNIISILIFWSKRINLMKFDMNDKINCPDSI